MGVESPYPALPARALSLNSQHSQHLLLMTGGRCQMLVPGLHNAHFSRLRLCALAFCHQDEIPWAGPGEGGALGQSSLTLRAVSRSRVGINFQKK